MASHWRARLPLWLAARDGAVRFLYTRQTYLLMFSRPWVLLVYLTTPDPEQRQRRLGFCIQR